MMKEFSKRVIAVMILLWFAGALFGGTVVAIQLSRGEYTPQLEALLNYIGLPMSGGIVGYLIKSAYENKEKIKQHAQSDNENVI